MPSEHVPAAAGPEPKAVANARSRVEAPMRSSGPVVPAWTSSLLALQRHAGNRAVSRLVSRPVQREGFDMSGIPEQFRVKPNQGAIMADPAAASGGSSTAFEIPDALQLKPDDSGKDPSTMSWKELENAIDEHVVFIQQHRESSAIVTQHEERIKALQLAQQQLAIRAGSADLPRNRRERTKPKNRPALPQRPRSLDGSLYLEGMKPEAVRQEFDLVVAYLAAKPPKAEREILMQELPSLEEAAGIARQQRQSQKRLDAAVEKIASKADDEATLLDTLRAVESAGRDPAEPDTWILQLDGQFYPLRTPEMDGLRKQLAKALTSTASQVNGILWDTKHAWEERTATNRKHNYVHALVKFRTGTEDIPAKDIKNMENTGDAYVAWVRNLAYSGKFVEAAKKTEQLQLYARHWANKVGEWESQLVRSAGYWVIALTLVKEALTFWTGLGAAKYIAGASGTLGTIKAATSVIAVSTATGTVVGGIGAKLTGQDAKQGARLGLGAGISVATNALTGSASKLASVRDAAKVGTLGGKVVAVGKAAGLETGITVLGGMAKAGAEGTSVTDSIKTSVVGGVTSSLGGGLVDKYAKTRRAMVAGKAAVGALGGYGGAKVAGQDTLVPTLVGAGGGAFAGSTAEIPGAGTAPGGGSSTSSTSGSATGSGTSPKLTLPAGGTEPAVASTSTSTTTSAGAGTSAHDAGVSKGAIPGAPAPAPDSAAPTPAGEPSGSASGSGPARPATDAPAKANGKSAGPAAGELPGLPPPLAELVASTGKPVYASEAEGGSGWKVVQLRKGEVFEAFGVAGKSSFKWMARVPEENWDWAQRGNQLAPGWYTGGGSRSATMVRYRITLTSDVPAGMSKVVDQAAALGRLGPAKFQYFTPAGFEGVATIERLGVVEVLMPSAERTLGPGQP